MINFLNFLHFFENFMNIDLLLLKRFNVYFQYLQTLKQNQSVTNTRTLPCPQRAERSKNEMEKPTNQL